MTLRLLDRIREMAGGYAAGQDTRFRKLFAFGRSRPIPEDELVGQHDRQNMNLELADQYRNNEIMRSIIDRIAETATGAGTFPQAKTRNSTWNQRTEDWWNNIFTQTCDYRQRPGVDLHTHVEMAIKFRLWRGQSFYHLLKNGQFQPIEADRIATPETLQQDPNVCEGVRTSKKGILLGYYVCPRNASGNVDRTRFDYVRREDMIHLMRPWRFDQINGIPDMAPGTNKCRDYDETDTYVLNKVKADGQRLYTAKTETGGPRNMQRRNAGSKTDGNDQKQLTEQSEWGTIIHLRPTESLNTLESKTPNQEYVPYMLHELRTVSSLVGLPLEFVLMIFTDGSYTAQRMTQLAAKNTMLRWHRWAVKWFLRRLWNWRIAKAMNEGDLPFAPIDPITGVSEWHRVDFSEPSFPLIDPQKDAQGHKMQWELGSTSLSRIARADGADSETILSEKEQDISRACTIAADLRKKFPDEAITWRDIINATIPGSITAAQSSPAGRPKKEQGDEK